MANHGFPLNRCKCSCLIASRPHTILTWDDTRMLPYRVAVGAGRIVHNAGAPTAQNRYSLTNSSVILGVPAEPTEKNVVLLNHTLPDDGWTLRGQVSAAGAVGSEAGLAFDFYRGGSSGTTPYYAVAGYRTGATSHEVFLRLPDGTETSRPCVVPTGPITVWRRGDWVFASFAGSNTHNGIVIAGTRWRTGSTQFGIEHPYPAASQPLAFGIYSMGERSPNFLEARYHGLGTTEGDRHYECSPVGHLATPANNRMRGFGVSLTPPKLDGIVLEEATLGSAGTSTAINFVGSTVGEGTVRFLLSQDPTKERWEVARQRRFSFTDVLLDTINDPADRHLHRLLFPGSYPFGSFPELGARPLNFFWESGSSSFGGGPGLILVSGVARIEYTGFLEIPRNEDNPPELLSLTVPTNLGQDGNALGMNVVWPDSGLRHYEALNSVFGSTFAEPVNSLIEIPEH